nr:MAG TPA: hypothetical protein [Caudoviricetes sp.]
MPELSVIFAPTAFLFFSLAFSYSASFSFLSASSFSLA